MPDPVVNPDKAGKKGAALEAKAATNFGLLRAAIAPVIAGLMVSTVSVVGARAAECPLAGQRPMLIVQLYFGQDTDDRGSISVADWQSFLRDELTSRFPDGLTIYDARGQWMNPKTQTINHERTKVVQIAVPFAPGVDAKIAEVAAAYRIRFHQRSVGIVTNTGCGVF